MGEIVRSDWVLDPDNPDLMIRREPDRRDAEYWQAVSKGDLVLSTAKMFETGSEGGSSGLPIFKPGKIDRQSFIQMFHTNTSGPENVSPGKLNVSQVWDPDEPGDSVKQQVQVGKLNIKDLFQNQEDSNNNNLHKPKAQIGKLDPHQIFESNKQEEERRESIKVGKLNTQNLFKCAREGSQEAEEALSPASERKIGKLDFDSIFSQDTQGSESQHSHSPRKVGKLNIKGNLYEAADEVDQLSDSCVRVGKLNPQAFLKQSSPTLQKEEIRVGKLRLPQDFTNSEKSSPTEESTRPKVGKLRSNPFEHQEHSPSEEQPRVKVGKLKFNPFENQKDSSVTTDNFDKTSRVEEVSRPRVGKLRNNPFEQQQADQQLSQHQEPKSPVQVGKLKQDIFQQKSEEESEAVKFYKPTVQPKKMKIDQVFPASDTNNNQENQKDDVRVGKLRAEQYLPKQEENTAAKNINSIPGKINTSKIFSKEDESPAESPSHVPIGRVKSSVFEARQEHQADKPVLRGARKLNRANRISCLIDNLTTEQTTQSADDTDQDENDLEVEEHFNLGKERLCQIQNMFSNSPGGHHSSSQTPRSRGARETESPNAEISELKSEGLVSSNLQRFVTGNVLGTSSSSHIPAKVLETNYLDKGHIEAVTQKFSGSTGSPETVECRPRQNVGKLKKQETFLQTATQPDSSKNKKEVRVGKLDTDIFKQKETDSEANSVTFTKKVGKINTENMFQKSDSEERHQKERITVGKLKVNSLEQTSSQEPRPAREVGRLSGDWLQTSPTDTEPSTGPLPRVGKLSENRLRFGQEDAAAEASADQESSSGALPRVGKLSEDRFKIGQEDGTEASSPDSDSNLAAGGARVGKLSEDRLKIGQEGEEEEREEDEEGGRLGMTQVRKLDEARYKLTAADITETDKVDDTHIVPSGTVSKSASAFLCSGTTTEDSAQSSKTKKSRSGNIDNTAEMQRKYEEQLANSKKAKEKKSQSFRMSSRDDSSVTSSRNIDKGKSLKRAETFVAESTRTKDIIQTRQVLQEDGEAKVSVQEAKAKFFASLQTSTTSEKTSSSVQKMGKSIIPMGGESKGKALFNRCAEKDASQVQDQQTKLLPGVDFEQIEDEFDRLHREMMGEE